jgi:hypothetical protein
MHDLHDADVRAVLAERLRAISKEKPDHEPPPAGKPKGTAKPKSKAKPGALVSAAAKPQAKTNTGALAWKGDHISCKAPAAKGHYYATHALDLIIGGGGPSEHYEVWHCYGPALLRIDVGHSPSTGHRSVGRAKTMEQAKVLAQKDHDKGRDRNAKELLAWEHRGTTHGRHTLEAPAANGIYRISPATDPNCYSVVHVVGDTERVIQAKTKHISAAIGLGQADYDRGKDQ